MPFALWIGSLPFLLLFFNCLNDYFAMVVKDYNIYTTLELPIVAGHPSIFYTISFTTRVFQRTKQKQRKTK